MHKVHFNILPLSNPGKSYPLPESAFTTLCSPISSNASCKVRSCIRKYKLCYHKKQREAPHPSGSYFCIFPTLVFQFQIHKSLKTCISEKFKTLRCSRYKLNAQKKKPFSGRKKLFSRNRTKKTKKVC